MTPPATARRGRGSARWPALGLFDGAPEQVGDRGHLEPGGGARGGALIAARQAPPASELGEGVLGVLLGSWLFTMLAGQAQLLALILGPVFVWPAVRMIWEGVAHQGCRNVQGATISGSGPGLAGPLASSSAA